MKTKSEKDSQDSKAVNPHSEDYDHKGVQHSGAEDVHAAPAEGKKGKKKENQEE